MDPEERNFGMAVIQARKELGLDADADAVIEKACRLQFNQDPKLRNEFGGDLEAYIGWRTAKLMGCISG